MKSYSKDSEKVSTATKNQPTKQTNKQNKKPCFTGATDPIFPFWQIFLFLKSFSKIL